MKKLLGILVLGLLLSGNAFAEWIYINSGSINDNGINLKLDKYKFLVVKNPMNFKNTFSHIKNIYILDTQGPTPPTCKHLKFKKMLSYFPKQLNLKFEEVLLEYNN